MKEGGQTPPETARSGPWFAVTCRSDKTLIDGTPSKSKGTMLRSLADPYGGIPTFALVAGACFLLALAVLVVELIVVLALAAGPALSLTDEMNLMLRKMNQGASDIDFNFGMTINQAPAGRAGLVAATPLAIPADGQNATDGTPTFDEASGNALLEWCESAACVRGQNCTDIITKMAEGVDPVTGSPIIPLPRTFCDGVQVLNDNLCFCEPEVSQSSFWAGPEGKVLLENMGFVAMLCPGFGQENVGQSGAC